MVKNHRVTGKAMTMTAGVVIGAGVSAVSSIIGTGLGTWLIDSGSLPEDGIGYVAMLVLLISAVVGAWLAVVLVKRQRLVTCIISGCIYLLLLLLVNLFCFGGQFQGLVPTLLLVAGGSVVPGLIGNRVEGNRTSVRHNRYYG